ncbi:MAG: Zn-ribbon domain-containing OB-fold protein [Solirubrobacteraceae bacterium]
MAREIDHPKPVADPETRGYWEGAGRHELVLQRCRRCGTVQHRPRALCVTCLGGEIEHFVASGRGTVWTFTVTEQNQAPPFRDATPYVLAYIELEEGPRLLTNVVGCAPAEVRIGLPVRAEFRADADGLAVPVFRPA